MVEYGAGGQLPHTSEAANGPETEGAEAVRGEGGTTGRDGGVRQNRRRRKAKGWFCPICRQREFNL